MPKFTVCSKLAEKPRGVILTIRKSIPLPKEPSNTKRTFHESFQKHKLEVVDALHRTREALHANQRKLAILVRDKSEQDRKVEETALLTVIKQQKEEEAAWVEKMHTLK